MADRFWVGGGSSTNFNATANTNWAATSGGANNASVPGTTDTAIFDANSGSGVVVLNASVAVQKFDAQDFAGTITHNTSVTMTINTSGTQALRLPITGTYGPGGTTAIFTLTNTTGTADITSNGKRFGALTTNGAGGTFRLLDALRVDAFQNSILTHTAGTFSANNFDVTAHVFASTNSNTRVINQGSGLWTVGGNAASGQTVWNLTTVTGLTFNKDTANIVVASNGLAGQRVFQGGGRTYNTLTINANSGKGSFHVAGNNTFTNFVMGEGNALEIVASGTQTITNAFAIVGTAALPVAIQGQTAGTQSTIAVASGASTVTWGVFRDMVFSGGTFSATDSLDLGNNSGITIVAPVTTSYPTAAAIAAAVWDEPTVGNVTAGTFGAQVKTVVDAIDAKTTNLPSDPADASVIAGRFDTLDTTLAGTLLADIRKVNNIAVSGSGTEVDPWGP